MAKLTVIILLDRSFLLFSAMELELSPLVNWPLYQLRVIVMSVERSVKENWEGITRYSEGSALVSFSPLQIPYDLT
jgi:hypothetical protein